MFTSDFITYNVDTQEIALMLDGNNQGMQSFKPLVWM